MIVTSEPIGANLKRISWAAVIAGLFVALAIELVFSLLGVGIGASTIHAVAGDGASAGSIGVGSGVWFLVSTMLALFAGGWVAGRLSGSARVTDGALHGIVAWSITTLATAYLLTTAVGGILGGATGLLGSALSAAGSGVAAASPAISSAIGSQVAKSGVTTDTITTKVQSILRETGNAKLTPEALSAQAKHQGALAKNAVGSAARNPQAAHQNYNDLVYRFLHDTGTTSQAADRDALINVVATEQHVSKYQAGKTVDGWAAEAQAAQRQAQEALAVAQEKGKEAADATAAGVSRAAIGAFFLLLLGAAAAAGGGILSARNERGATGIVSTRARPMA